MPKDNHSLMQLYLDGNRNSFFTFFDVKNNHSPKINKKIFGSYKYLKKHNLLSVKSAQKQATINVFREKGIPFRNIEVLKKNEETLGDLFIFFMLETILLGKMLKINPYNQPAVELIKKETKKILFSQTYQKNLRSSVVFTYNYFKILWELIRIFLISVYYHHSVTFKYFAIF